MSSDFGFESAKSKPFLFISYNTEDAARVGAICDILNRKGVPLWYDNSIPDSSQFDAIITDHIANCQEMILFITKGIFEKAQRDNLPKYKVWPWKEYDFACTFDKKVHIVTLDSIHAKTDVPMNLLPWWQEISPQNRQGIIAINSPYDKTAEAILKVLDFKRFFSVDEGIDFPVFNSVYNHPKHGDERCFVHIREYGTTEWTRTIKMKIGKQYEVDIFYKNDADEKNNYQERSRKGVALVSRVSVSMPMQIGQFTERISACIMADNSRFDCEDYVEINTDAAKNLRLRYIAGSSRILNNWSLNNSIVSSALFTKAGALIGCNGFNGVIPGGDAFSGHIRFVVEVQEESSTESIQILSDQKERLASWGPTRETFTWQKPSLYTTFNSIVNNPSLGDERNFVRIREYGTNSVYTDEVDLLPGRQYEVYIYVHNNASSSVDAVAENVTVSTSMPCRLKSGECAVIRGTIRSDSSYPAEVWDVAYANATTDCRLTYVPKSLAVHYLMKENSHISDETSILTDSGLPLGNISNSEENSRGYITFRFSVS